jgi:hypothetical protein
MTTYDLCIKLGKVLSRHIKSKLYHQGILRTVQEHNRDVKIDVMEVHKSLKDSIEEVKRKSEKTISMLQEAIDIIEDLPRKK